MDSVVIITSCNKMGVSNNIELRLLQQIMAKIKAHQNTKLGNP